MVGCAWCPELSALAVPVPDFLWSWGFLGGHVGAAQEVLMTLLVEEACLERGGACVALWSLCILQQAVVLEGNPRLWK